MSEYTKTHRDQNQGRKTKQTHKLHFVLMMLMLLRVSDSLETAERNIKLSQRLSRTDDNRACIESFFMPPIHQKSNL